MSDVSGILTADWEGKHYTLDLEAISARDFRQIKAHTGLNAGQILRAFMNLSDLDADAAVALLWLFQKHSGENAVFNDDLPVFKFMAAMERTAPAKSTAEDADPKG